MNGPRSLRLRGEALVDLEIPPAMGCIEAQADGIAVRRLPYRTLGFQRVYEGKKSWQNSRLCPLLCCQNPRE